MDALIADLREKLDADEAALKSMMEKKVIEAVSFTEITLHTMALAMPRPFSWAPYEVAAITRLHRRVQIGRELIAYYERESGDSRATLEQVLRMFASEWRP